jgi:hypothetical protein
MSDHTKPLTFRDPALALKEALAVLTASLMTLEVGDTLRVILPSLNDKQFQKWRYAVITLCKQWDALITNGSVLLSMFKSENGKHECLYEAEFDI